MSIGLTRDSLTNTKWDTSEWTEEMKIKWQEKMFEFRFTWQHSNVVDYLEKPFYYLQSGHEMSHGRERGWFTEHQHENKLYTDVFPDEEKTGPTDGETSGGSCDYYRVTIDNPTTEAQEKYTAECNDVIEALNMTYAEANMFKEIWRSASARTLGKKKAGHTSLRGAEKIEFFAKRNLIQKSKQV